MSLDASSSQMRWIFTEDQLEAHRSEANTRAKSRIAPELVGNALTVADEQMLLLYYTQTAGKICDNLRVKQPAMPVEVKATAISFLRRFFVHKSIMEVDPTLLSFTCAFVACKAEEFHIFSEPRKGGAVQQFLAVPKMFNGTTSLYDQLKEKMKVEDPVSSIEAAEMRLLEGNKFHLMFHHPFKALEGWLLKLRAQNPKLLAEELRKPVKERATALITQALLTDLVLLHPPSRIALGALMVAYREKENDIDSIVDVYLGGQNCNRQRMKEMLADIQTKLCDEMKELKIQDLDANGDIFKRIKKIWSKVPGSVFFKKEKKKKRSASPAPQMPEGAAPPATETGTNQEGGPAKKMKTA